jgi:hypothetical protein
MCRRGEPCRLSLSECHRSYARIQDGETFIGEDSDDYNYAKRTNSKDIDRLLLCSGVYGMKLSRNLTYIHTEK